MNFAKFLGTSILLNICKRLLLENLKVLLKDCLFSRSFLSSIDYKGVTSTKACIMLVVRHTVSSQCIRL